MTNVLLVISSQYKENLGPGGSTYQKKTEVLAKYLSKYVYIYGISAKIFGIDLRRKHNFSKFYVEMG